MAGKFEVKKGKSGFTFNLKASNGRVVLTSERYNTKAAAMNGMKSVMKNAKKATAFETRKSKRNEPYFVLNAANGETIGRSEMYTSTSGMKTGIRSVMNNAPGAKIDDLT